jgi:hypothetical protein
MITKESFEVYSTSNLKIKLKWYYNQKFKKDWHKRQALMILDILMDRGELEEIKLSTGKAY